MANDLLIEAIRESGLDLNDVAEIAEVDPRTVQRWLGGRLPHPRYRQRLATALKLDEDELWPELLALRRKTALDEIAGAWARRDDPATIDWRALLRGATEQIDLLGYSLSQVLSSRGINKQLRAKARDGCAIRIAIAKADVPHVITTDLEQRPPGRLVSRIRQAQEQLAELAGQDGIEIRLHDVPTSHTILRFDDQLLLTIHLHRTPGFQAPLIHIRRERDYSLYDQLVKHLEDIWENATPLLHETPPSTATAPAEKPADDFLESLDHIWRPGQ